MGYLTQPCPVLICLQLLLLYFQCSAKLCSHDQSSALLQFKQLFSFEQHSSSDCDEVYQQSRPKMMSWKEDADCCSWDGVTCDTVAGHVIGLDLSCSWLHGNIPSNSSLFFLPHIRKLNLAFNDFNYSEISSGFSQLRSLTLLNLSSSNFMGSIPASIGLCGFPLLESCNIDEAPEPVGSTRFDEEEDASSWFDWKFAKMGYGSGLVIGLSVGYMVFGTGKPRWLVRMIEKYQSNKVRIRVSSLGIARRN